MFIPADPGYLLLFGECGGKILYHPAGVRPPTKYHLCISFEDGSSLSAITQMWGAMELYVQGEERERQYVKDMRPTPLDDAFTYTYFDTLLDTLVHAGKRSVKSLLTQDQLIPGLGNAIAQDILFHAQLHPKHGIGDLTAAQRNELYQTIMTTVHAIIAQGGRYDEVDLYGNPGGYVRLMDQKSAGSPCPRCGTPTEKIQYLGGACYFCPTCQRA